MNPFHLAFPITDIEETRNFYCNVLGCIVGRESDDWIDFNFFGHQLSAHLKPEECVSVRTNSVDKEQVPVRHFGIVMEWSDWEKLANKIANNNIEFLIQPDVRFKGKAGEQGSFFIKDPSGNVLEFKSFRDMANLFKADMRY